ncbi:PEP/pyruvate-binding domain-containing protein [Deltaproteobacteria bacterium TL4]
MFQGNEHLSTGLRGLDQVLRGLIPGDNLVWRVDSIADYVPFVQPYYESARTRGKRLIYMRFANHEALLSDQPGLEIHTLNPHTGFETFIEDVHAIIEKSGRGAWYLFDCLSELAAIWRSDIILGNFFVLTCPYLYDVEAVAYFALIRYYNASEATTLIKDTAQVVLDVYRHKGALYLQPLKILQRHSPTMHMLHVWQQDNFLPVADSATTTEILSAAPCIPSIYNRFRHGIWNQTFRHAEEIIQAKNRDKPYDKGFAQDILKKLIRMTVTRNKKMLKLVEKYFTLEDLLALGKRIIGTGLIGGKSTGMLLSRAILKQTDPRWEKIMEAHDSFYVGSDVFVTFLVKNGLWWKWQKHRNPERFLHKTERIRQHIIVGTFPDYIKVQMQDMLDYFGQSPIIVRSSSLLEDSFGHSFVGKYVSVFLASQGSREQRMQDFMSAVRTIYASVVSEDALKYRFRRGMLSANEQMALLVQRVSGSVHGNLFYPHIAGVGLSYNPYVWSKDIDPYAGVLRLVLGLGTRAVDRTDDDFTRLIALNDPLKRPVENADDVLRYIQRRVDVLDLQANQLVTQDFEDVAKQSPGLPIEIFASRDEKREKAIGYKGREIFPWVITFDSLIRKTDYIETMSQMLKQLQDIYGCPVDLEFTTNFLPNDTYKINFVQCRPLQVKGDYAIANPPEQIEPEDLILKASGAIIGVSQISHVDRIIYVVPSIYGQLALGDRYSVARIIGKIVHQKEQTPQGNIMLIGPGRWGTSTPSLGVPTSFGEISTISVLVEIVAMHENLVPEVSLGSHFFNELVESEILYFALFPEQDQNVLNSELLCHLPNRFSELMPEDSKWSNVIRVIDASSLEGNQSMILNANAINQQVICYLETSQ